MGKKLYVGNIPRDCDAEQLRDLFSKFGTVKECDVMGKYAFVHMSTDSEGDDAVSNLDSYNFLGSYLNVKHSTGVSSRGGGSGGGGGGGYGGSGRTKLYVGNLPEGCNEAQLQKEFQKYGEVAECDVIRNYGFVHMKTEACAASAVQNLNNTKFLDQVDGFVTVKFSTSVVHKSPGVGSKGECFKCGNRGHLSRDCDDWGSRGRGRGGSRGGYPPRGSSRGSGRGSAGRSSYNGYGNDSYDSYYDYPPARRQPPVDDYYSRHYPSEDYYRRPASREYTPSSREYAYPRARSRSPVPTYRRRLSPAADYDRHYERLPARDPYYDLPPRRVPPPREAPTYSNGAAERVSSRSFADDVDI